MKLKYLITGLIWTVILAFAACESPDDLIRSDSESVTTLSVKGCLVSNESVEYEAVVDMDAKTITVQVPYYLSDTEMIQGDLTEMKLTASLPVGSKFETSLAGIHNLREGIQRTMVNEDGTRINFTINAVYLKSSKALLTRIYLNEAPNAIISVKEPENEGEDGIIVIFKTSSSIDAALKSAVLTVSPWATFESTALKPDGTVDMSDNPVIYVTAQDGTVRKYVTVINLPSFVGPGKIGYISLLFGFQTTVQNTRGFIATENRSMAIIGDYLVVSSVSLNFVVMDRFSGKLLSDVQVNTTGLPTGVIHAITNDEANHLIAITFASVNNQWVSNRQLEIYVWKNGITNPPEKVFSEDLLTGSSLEQFRSTNSSVVSTGTWDIARTIAVKGDVTGTAMLMTLANNVMNRLLRVKFENGKVASVLGSARGLYSWNTQSKPIPLSTDDECDFFMCSTNMNYPIIYTPQTTGSNTIFYRGVNWWDARVIGMDYIEFNGTKLIGIQNVNGSPMTHCRLCVGDVKSMDPYSFVSSQIMDSRLDNYDPAFGETGPGKGNSSMTGMTSTYNFVSGTTVLGTNPNATGDVRFAKSEDGSAVQVYMLTTDHGMFAYELTLYDL